MTNRYVRDYTCTNSFEEEKTKNTDKFEMLYESILFVFLYKINCNTVRCKHPKAAILFVQYRSIFDFSSTLLFFFFSFYRRNFETPYAIGI